ncbi:lipopolysaccharide biosynthesis protein [Nostoc sp.]|uniref:lipopolysaccharide biosynthesis protein n=1 Tax=Nostoc sp. TaxID=1180 RepID=UPI002FFD0FB7
MPKHLFKILDKVTPGASRSLGWEVLMSAMSFPASLLLNRTLGAEDRGLLALVILVPSTIFVLGTCQWDRLLKGLITSKQISAREAWRRTTYYAFCLSVIFIPLGAFASLAFDKIPQNIRWLSIIYNANFPIYFLGGCLSAIYVAAGSIDGQYLMRIGLQGSYLVLIYALLLTNFLSVKTVIFIYIAIHTISLGMGWFKKHHIITGEICQERPSLIPLFHAFFPYSLESFSTRIDIWAFSIFGSLVSLGHYTGITALMLPIGLVSNALTSASTAKLDWTKPDIVRRYLMKTVSVLLCLLLVLVIGDILLGSSFMKLLLGRSFEGGEWMIPWIAVIVVGQAAAIQAHSSLQLCGYRKNYLIIQIIEPFLRGILVLIIGYFLSELGIMLGIAISSYIKVITCFIFIRYRKV